MVTIASTVNRRSSAGIFSKMRSRRYAAYWMVLPLVVLVVGLVGCAGKNVAHFSEVTVVKAQFQELWEKLREYLVAQKIVPSISLEWLRQLLPPITRAIQPPRRWRRRRSARSRSKNTSL